MAGKKKILVENFDEEVIESLDSIKKKLEKKGKNSGYLNQEDIFEATSHFDLSEDDLDNLITYFKDKGIDVISEDAESDLVDGTTTVFCGYSNTGCTIDTSCGYHY